jgi:hypothetical protein
VYNLRAMNALADSRFSELMLDQDVKGLPQ